MNTKGIASLLGLGLLLLVSPLFWIFGIPFIIIFGCLFFLHLRRNKEGEYQQEEELSQVVKAKQLQKAESQVYASHRLAITKQVKENFGLQATWMYFNPNDQSQIVILLPSGSKIANIIDGQVSMVKN